MSFKVFLACFACFIAEKKKTKTVKKMAAQIYIDKSLWIKSKWKKKQMCAKSNSNRKLLTISLVFLSCGSNAAHGWHILYQR